MNTEENLTQDNREPAQPEPAYRKPNVQNFRSLHSDVVDTAKKQDQSLVQIVLSAKEKKWQEKQSGKAAQKVYFENIYKKPVYKILLVVIIMLAIILFAVKTVILRNVPTREQNTSSSTTSTPSTATTTSQKQ